MSPRVDTPHGRNCNCHTCARLVPARRRTDSRGVWIKPNAAQGIAAIFNQGKV
jgi:hypothetical protein